MVAAKVWMWRATSPSVAGRPAEDAGQAGARIAALVGAAQQEVGRDRVQEQPRQCPSAVTADAADQPDREPAAAFAPLLRSEEHTSELQSLMRISYAVFYLNKQHTLRRTKSKHQNK